MRGNLGRPSESAIVIIFSNCGPDGTRYLPKHLDFVLPLHRDSCLDQFHLKTTTWLAHVARFTTKEQAERFLRICLRGIQNSIHYQDHDWLIRNHISILPWADAVPLIRTH